LLSAAVAGLVLLAIWIVAKDRIHDEVCRAVQCRLAEHYAGLRVSVHSAKVIEGRGIEIHGVTIADKDGRTALVHVDEMFAVCPISLEQLLTGEKPQAERILLRGVQAWAKQRPDGTWNLDQLWPPPKFGPNSPPTTVMNAAIEVAVVDNGNWSSFTFRNVNLQVTPEHPAEPNRQLAGDAYRPPVRIQGSFEGDHFERVNLQGQVDPNAGTWEAEGVAEGLQLSPRLHADLPASWREKLASAASISGQVRLQFRLAHNEAEEHPVQFAVSGALSDGQITDPRLPVRLYDAEAQFYWDNDRVTIETLSARNGDTWLNLSFQRNGFEEDSPLRLQAGAKKLALNERFVEFLPDEPFPLRTMWRKYYPIGVVDVDIDLEFDGRHWKPDLQMVCHDVSFTYHRFPYRLDRGRGKVTLKENVLGLDIEALAGGQTVNIRGDIAQPTTYPTGSVTVMCEQPIPLDNKLIAAIVEPPTAQRLVRSFDPGGTISVVGTFTFDGPGKEGMHKDVKIGLHNCTMQYERLPYPLGMIRGTLLWKDDGWTFQNLSGRNDSGYIECSGSWKRTNDGSGVLALDLVGIAVPLEDELRDSLSPNAAHLWGKLRPRGSIDHLMVGLRYTSATKRLSVNVRAQQWEKRQKDEGRSISIHPEWFPYRLDDVAGIANYTDGVVTFEGVSGLHNDTKVTLSGQCNFDEDGRWQVRLTDIVADRVRFDRELLEALPEELGKAAGRLNVRGNIGMRGWLSFAGHAEASDLPTANWDVAFDIENGSMQCGLQLDHIHGDVRLYGGGGQQGYYSHGELHVDSMFCRDIQLTRVRGPLLISPTQVVLGAESERNRADGPPRQVTADVFDGNLSVDAVVQLDSKTPYLVQARLERGDLGLLANEMALQNRDVRGKVNALINLGGNGYGRHSWRGNGLVRLYDADIYKIPVMLALLKDLPVRSPDRTAFTSSEIDFRIEGEQAYLDRINFHGDVISLKGYGEVNLARQVDLKFYTLIGRREFDWQVLRSLVQQASSQILAIRVTGTLDQPELTRLPLPAIKDALQQLFPEVAKRREERRELGLPVFRPLEPVRRRVADRLGGLLPQTQ